MIQCDINTIKEQLMENCIVNGEFIPLRDIEKMGIHEFGIRSKLNMPLKLYKYFSNKIEEDKYGQKNNYSHFALINNTVYLQSPTLYDDVFDSDISLDIAEYARLSCLEYCRRCGVKVNKKWSGQEAGDALIKALWPFYQDKSLEKAFTYTPENELEKLSNDLFCSRILNKCTEVDNFGAAVSNAIYEEYYEHCMFLRNTFRTACFTTTSYSQLMWGGLYADQHKGFCLEYTVLPQDDAYRDVYYTCSL